jgi:glycosyltransferase involved in cell wall biosynthesis
VDNGLQFVWYVIGDGEEKQTIANEVVKYKVEDYVKMLGGKSNPHFYIKRAYLYVCLSSSEACPRVVNEAKILSTPVVSTDFPTIYEYIEDGVNGRIVQLEDVSQAITELLNNQELYSNIKKEISAFTFDNSNLIKQLEEIL